MISRLKAFTLAEVLITLGIIGIVAEMTIPTLMNNVNEQVYVNSLKKAYTVYTQAFKTMSADNNCTNDLACTGVFANTTTDATLGAEVKKYVKVLKDCAVADTSCFASSIWQKYDGSVMEAFNTSTTALYKFITADGMSVLVQNTSNNCTSDSGSGKLDSSVCGLIVIDVNGLKKPNKAGRDVFSFYITRDAMLYPYGGRDEGTSAWTTNCASSSFLYGRYCTGRIIEKGWVMDY